jgi:hypothetical protein
MTMARNGSFGMAVNHSEQHFEQELSTDNETAVTQYIELEHTQGNPDTSFDQTGVTYTVAKRAVPEDTAPEKIAIHRYNDTLGEWQNLSGSTELVGESDSAYHFAVTTPSFSQFAVTTPAADSGSNSSDSTPPTSSPSAPATGTPVDEEPTDRSTANQTTPSPSTGEQDEQQPARNETTTPESDVDSRTRGTATRPASDDGPFPVLWLVGALFAPVIVLVLIVFGAGTLLSRTEG